MDPVRDFCSGRKTAFESYRPQPPESNRAARAVRVIKQPKKKRIAQINVASTFFNSPSFSYDANSLSCTFARVCFANYLSLKWPYYISLMARLCRRFRPRYLVPSGFLSVILPIFGSTTGKFRQLYSLRLVSQPTPVVLKWLAPCCAPRSLLSGARTCNTNEQKRDEKQSLCKGL
jgi:hypothetical protein